MSARRLVDILDIGTLGMWVGGGGGDESVCQIKLFAKLCVHFFPAGICQGSSWFAVMAELELKDDSNSPEAKKALVSLKIGTHNGTFHCDEALACFMLKQLPEYKHADIIRTRNPEELSKCDVVVDVGGVYDADKHRYDHHQRYVVNQTTSV